MNAMGKGGPAGEDASALAPRGADLNFRSRSDRIVAYELFLPIP